MVPDRGGSLPPSASAVDLSPSLREQGVRALHLVRRGARYWYACIVTLLLGGLSCVGYFALEPPVYRSETALLHSEGVASADPTEPVAAPKNIAVRVQEILMSRQLLGRVLTELDLYKETRLRYGVVEAVDELKKHVQFKAPGGNTFRIAFDGTSPEEAQRVTARLADLVMSRDAELRAAQARLTLDFLVGENTRTEAVLRDGEHRLASFMALHPRFALDATPLTSGAAIRASVQPVARTQHADVTPRSRPPREAATQPPATPAGAPGPMPAMREALREQARAAVAVEAAQTHLADELARFTPAHPDVRAAEAALSLAEARLTIATAASQQPEPASLPVVTPATPPQPEPLSRSARAPRPVEVVAAAPVDLVALETEWSALTRDVIEARQHYDQVQVALFRAAMTVSSVTSEHPGAQMTVIDAAFLPQRPVPPGRVTIAVIAGGLSLLLGMLIALTLGLLDDRIYTRGDSPRVEVLVEVPRMRRGRADHAAAS